jgi:hypothetical protein
MLKRASLWSEKQNKPENRPAVPRRRSFILKAIKRNYQGGSSKFRGTEYIHHSGAMLVSTALSSGLLDLEDTLIIIDNETCDSIFQGGSENEGTLSLRTEQPGCSKNVGKSDLFCETPVHSTLSSSLEAVVPKKQKCCSILQTCTSQRVSESEMIISHLLYLNQELSLDATRAALSVNQRSQVDGAEHWPVTNWEYDSLSTNCYFPSYAHLIPSVPVEHQKENCCGFSSDKDQEQILNVAEQLLLADEIFEIDEDTEKYTQVRIVFWDGKSIKQSVVCLTSFPPSHSM